jgi:hypothetical protein
MTAPIHDLHVSNLLTYTSLGLAIAAVATAADGGSFAAAGALLAAAALADTFDGRVARRFTRTDRQRQVGAELDSLVDAMVFGLAPIVILSAPARPDGRPDSSGMVGGCFLLRVRNSDPAQFLQRITRRVAVCRRADACDRLDMVDLSAGAGLLAGRAGRSVGVRGRDGGARDHSTAPRRRVCRVHAVGRVAHHRARSAFAPLAPRRAFGPVCPVSWTSPLCL